MFNWTKSKCTKDAAVNPVWTNKCNQYTKYAIGDWTYGFPRVKDWKQGAKLRIGKYCSIAENTTILLGGEHRTDWITTFPFAELLSVGETGQSTGWSKGDVIIGNDVWLGMGATVLSGVTIGSGSVIGAGSVVAKSIDPYSVVAGNPARHIKFRIPADVIPAMLKIAWWDWAHEKVLAAAPLLLSNHFEEFIEKYGRNAHHEAVGDTNSLNNGSL